ncbi:hypothetical protein F5I97DRAFT_1816059 [Phlebopus sp. FC_14]|nr:hypothetical protein F5I97DRAFT_1816059 [Phlebopus sp. FC_14]
MAPPRAKERFGTSNSGIPKGQLRKKPKHYAHNERHATHGHEDALPGVQKLKSSLRQAKRLLAKENLAANVRVETERRLKALEADLSRAEDARKERTLAVRYHKVKFFERQKVLRRITQTKRKLSTASNTQKEELELALADQRVDLNYIVHYPKTKKYISLFPPDVRFGTAAPATAATADENDERSNVRALIRSQMARGELSNEPENEVVKSKQEREGPNDTRLRPGRKESKSTQGSQRNLAKQKEDVVGDDFFDNDDDNEQDDDDDDSRQTDDSDSDSS